MGEADKEQMQKMVKHFSLDMDKIFKCQTWREFDEEFTIKIHP